ncbi:hypothetical protein ACUVMQ_15295 [Aeromonas veronii]|uniref:hypothetical protein n=1 Tax=Aeromonas veronii TaxID=654 RepID=UPI0040554B00
MMGNYALIENTGLVVNLFVWDETTAYTPPDGHIVVKAGDAQIGWTYADGKFVAPKTVPAQPTAEQITASLTASVQAHMDTQARALNYDDIKTAVTYADEPAVPKFQAEGLAFREWRSLGWAHYYAVLDAVNAGEREIPTSAELIAELPPLALPA